MQSILAARSSLLVFISQLLANLNLGHAYERLLSMNNLVRVPDEHERTANFSVVGIWTGWIPVVGLCELGPFLDARGA